MGLTVSVIVPSYRRPDQLAACLAGLTRQLRPADEVVVVRREGDQGTAEAVAAAPLPVVEVVVTQPGVLAALRAGAQRSSGDVVAFTDDDAVPRPDWLSALLVHYNDAAVGGVGGRDESCPGPAGPAVPSSEVGSFNAWGRHAGNHDVGVGPAVRVEVLKGVNMSFRREALAIPLRLRGKGAEVHNEIAISLWARARGWDLVYDPGAVVDHHHGPRFDSDQRGRPARDAVSNEAYNLVFVLLSLRPALLVRRSAFGLLVGDRATPGLLRALVALLRRESDVPVRLGPALAGQLAALRDLAQGRRLEVLEIAPTRSSREDRVRFPITELETAPMGYDDHPYGEDASRLVEPQAGSSELHERRSVGARVTGLAKQRLPRPLKRWVRRHVLHRLPSKKALVPAVELTAAYEAALRLLLQDEPTRPLGDYVEFGVGRGTSMACMAEALRRVRVDGVRLIGFDSFQGLPAEVELEDGGLWHAGQFRTSQAAVVRNLRRDGVDLQRVVLVPGWFEDTATPGTARELDLERVSIAMIDCDAYSSARVALEFVAPLLADRAVLVFDDWHSGGLGSVRQGERRAFEEMLAERPDLREVDRMTAYARNAEVIVIERGGDRRVT